MAAAALQEVAAADAAAAAEEVAAAAAAEEVAAAEEAVEVVEERRWSDDVQRCRTAIYGRSYRSSSCPDDPDAGPSDRKGTSFSGHYLRRNRL